MQSKFFAFMSRMKYIKRWGLMRSTVDENVAEHSLQVVWVAHALAVIENKMFGGNYNAERIGMIGAYHETGEIITGDLSTPIKYFSPEIATAYKKVERVAEDRILSTLPNELMEDIASLVQPTAEEKRLVKCADKITALIKCEEELACKNLEFKQAHDTIEKDLRAFNIQSVNYFLETFIPAFKLTLDEISMD